MTWHMDVSELVHHDVHLYHGLVTILSGLNIGNSWAVFKSVVVYRSAVWFLTHIKGVTSSLCPPIRPR